MLKRFGLSFLLGMFLIVVGCGSSSKKDTNTNAKDDLVNFDLNSLDEDAKSLYDILDKKTTRIINGDEVTDLSKYPWMVALTKEDGFQFCAGVLIDSKWVLTAAHCLFNSKGATSKKKPSEIKVLLGTLNKRKGGTVVGVKSVNPHKYYRSLTLNVTKSGFDATYNNFDIGLLELEQEVAFEPIKLATDSINLLNKSAIALGWGKTDHFDDNSDSDILQQVLLPIVPNQECSYGLSESWNNFFKFNSKKEISIIINDNMLCAGFHDANKDTSQGDSGGPLIIKNDTKWELIGLTSYGSVANDSYGVYTRVSSFKRFMSSFGNRVDTTQSQQQAVVDLKPLSISGWTSPVVISTKECTKSECVSASKYTPTDTLYLSLAIQNIGQQIPANTPNIKTAIYFDNIAIGVVSIDSKMLNQNQWDFQNIKLNNVSVGKHTIRVVIDTNNNILESDEFNNEFLYTFTVGDQTKDEKYYIDQFYNDSKSFFGEKVGGTYDCYGDNSWLCQNFSSGKKISVSRADFAIEWWDKKWIEFTYGTDIYSDTNKKEDVDIYIDQFYNDSKSFFGEKVGRVYTCFQRWRCQSFSSGMRISVNKSDLMLEWENPRWEWHEYGIGSQLYP